MNKKCIVTGATGQTGSYMIEYLLDNTENIIICAIRRTSQSILSNLKKVLDNPRVKLVNMDLCDAHSIDKIITEEKPDYFLNFGGQTFVSDSWTTPALHMQTNAISLIHILEAVRKHCPTCRVYSSGSSEQFGDVKYSPQNDKHPMSPRSIYAVSKCAASQICKVYRESYGLHVIHGILFNHESERRQDYFVTRKITKGIARILKSIEKGEKFEPIKLGNLNAKRDWSHAEDFCVGVWMMINQENYRKDLLKHLESSKRYDTIERPTESDKIKYLSSQITEYILSSNETHSIREFCNLALKYANIEGYWQGEGENEKFYLADYVLETISVKPSVIIEVSKEFFRPNEVALLLGDSTPAREELGWAPKISFDNLVSRMVSYDIDDSKKRT